MVNGNKHFFHNSAPQGLEYIAMVLKAALDMLAVRDVVTVAALAALMTSLAGNAADYFRALQPDAEMERLALEDPIIAEVGSTPLRLSDARALAEETGDPNASLPVEAILSTGLMENLADQAALAELARKEGINAESEISAALALAERQILSSAYLDHVVSARVTEESLRAAYQDALERAALDQKVRLRRLMVASEQEALALKARVDLGEDFDELARRRSLDMDSRGAGGDMGMVRLGSLPSPIAQAASRLPLGAVSSPIQGKQGWYLITVEARQSVHLPSYAEMREGLAQQLRRSVIEEQITLARVNLPMKATIEPTEDTALVLPTAVALGAVW